MPEQVDAVVVITTVGDEEQANTLARELLVRRHAACVNLVPGMKSMYRWQSKICLDGELMLVIKTLRSEYPAVAETIRELHRYDVPEILAFDISAGDPEFLDWIAASLDKSAAFEEEVENDLPSDVDL